MNADTAQVRPRVPGALGEHERRLNRRRCTPFLRERAQVRKRVENGACLPRQNEEMPGKEAHARGERGNVDAGERRCVAVPAGRVEPSVEVPVGSVEHLRGLPLTLIACEDRHGIERHAQIMVGHSQTYHVTLQLEPVHDFV